MKIIHIRQLHGLNTILPGARVTAEFSLAVIKSQFMIAQILRKYPGCPILVEGVVEKEQSGPEKENIELAKKMFPTGFPTEIDKLTPRQDSCLYYNGTPHTLYNLGEIKEIHATISPIVQHLVEQKLEAGQAEVMVAHRDIEAINYAKKIVERYFGENTEDATIIIIFGNAHDFSPYCEREGFELEEIDTFNFPVDATVAIKLLDEKLAVLTQQLRQNSTDEDTRGLYQWVLMRKQALREGKAVCEIDSQSIKPRNKRLLDSMSILASLHLDASLTHQQLLAELEIWQEKNKQLSISTVIGAVQARDYSLALRRVCCIGHFGLVKLIGKYDIHLAINYKVTSSNGYSPLDWVERAKIDETVRGEIKAFLIERMEKGVADLNVVDEGVAARDLSTVVRDSSKGLMLFKQEDSASAQEQVVCNSLLGDDVTNVGASSSS